MNVLHLLSSSVFSGAENVVCQIINMFKGDASVSFIYCSPDGDIKYELESRGINYVPLSSFSIREVRHTLKAHRSEIDIIHAHDISASVAASIASIGLSIPVISHVHVNNDNMSHLNFKTCIYLFSALRFKHIFWVSQSCFDNYYFRRLVNKKSTVLTNVIDKNDIIIRSETAQNKAFYDIVYVGRITYQKNPEKLIRVLALIVNALPNVKIGIVGTGDLLDNTKRLSEQYGLTHNVSFLGFVSNPLGILAKARFMIMTSRFEGLPMTALESLALGVPIISTPVDGLLNVVQTGENGFLVEDEQQMADYAVLILTDEGIRKKMSENAKLQFDRVSNITSYKETISSTYKTSK